MKAAFVATLALTSLISASAAFAQVPAHYRLPPKEIQRDPLTEIPSTMSSLCYPNSKFAMGTLTRYARTKTTRILRISAPAPVATVKEWYERTLPGVGYRPSTGNPIASKGQSAAIYATKTDGSTCMVNLAAESGNTSTGVTLTVNDAR